MRRIALLVGVLAALLLVGLGLLVARALDSVAAERAMRHGVLAERVFDELEAELTSLIEREEARPFLQYRFFYVPEEGVPGAEGLSRSPLAEVPAEDWLVGWFQVDPDGTVSTPLVPRDPELGAMVGWSATPELDARAAALRDAAAAVPVRPSGSLPDEPPPPAETPILITEPTPAPRRVEPAKEPQPAEPEVAEEDGLAVLGTTSSPTGRKVASKEQEKVAEKKQAVAAPYGIGSLNKGASSRSARQQRVERSKAETLRSYQYPQNNAEIVRGDELPEVAFEGETQQAVGGMVWDSNAAAQEAGEDGDAVAALDGDLAAGSGLVGPNDDELLAVEDELQEEEEAAAEDAGLDAVAMDERVATTESLAREERSAPRRPLFGRRRNKQTAAAPSAAPAAEAPSMEPYRDASAALGGESADEPAFAEEVEDALADMDSAESAPEAEPEEPEESEEPVQLAQPVQAQAKPTPVPAPAPAPAPVMTRPAPKQRVAQSRPKSSPKAKDTPETVAPTEVDVEISPFRGHRADDETLVLYRTVRIGDVVYVQGLALLLPKLAAWLESRVLGGSEVAPYLDLAWNLGAPAAPSLADFTFDHAFAEPFGSLRATSYLQALPEPRGSGRSWILQLTAALLVVGLLGVVALWRMISVVVQFAERRNNFVAAVSHELKTPLTAIRMYSEMLRDGYVLSEDKRDEYYATMAAESERLSRLIQNVLELSRLEKGANRGGGDLVTGDVRPVLEEGLRVLERHARDRGFILRLEVEPDLPAVRYERDGLLQVLINLVDNGIKFSKDADPREVVVEALRKGDGVQVRIRDHGPGVPQKQLRSIFQPFFRGERELTRRTKGTGIGLALVKGIVERMGGSVTARNHPDGGFEVRVGLVGV